MSSLARQLGKLLLDAVTVLAELAQPRDGGLVTLGAVTGRYPHEHRGALAPGTRWTSVSLKWYPGEPWLVVRCGACGLLATGPKALRLHRAPDGQCLDPATDRKPHGGLIMWDLPAEDGLTVWCWPNGRSRDLLAA